MDHDWYLAEVGSKPVLWAKGTGTEHMTVKLVDRLQQLLDRNPDRSAVVAVGVDWASAFDRVDPTIAIQKFIKFGVRPSLIPLLIDYISDRKMTVKFNTAVSTVFELVGGGPQRMVLGYTQYTVASNDVASDIDDNDRYKFLWGWVLGATYFGVWVGLGLWI